MQWCLSNRYSSRASVFVNLMIYGILVGTFALSVGSTFCALPIQLRQFNISLSTSITTQHMLSFTVTFDQPVILSDVNPVVVLQLLSDQTNIFSWYSSKSNRTDVSSLQCNRVVLPFPFTDISPSSVLCNTTLGASGSRSFSYSETSFNASLPLGYLSENSSYSVVVVASSVRSISFPITTLLSNVSINFTVVKPSGIHYSIILVALVLHI